ncbi:hypothetical protein SLEP1_g32851 [Rubroshorea leprosula]|uniref:DUF4005 domain-containing protein n=1 Tax=Rubroshorea leprosula TaxID=152421 RepID=A0AAV5KEU8_9ROSI|nr:hypothetical protein SLEP1_g32851 [Rubroshorea leprosula]
MGKASKWFRNLLGLRKPDPHHPTSKTPPFQRDKRRWNFVKSYREKDGATTTTEAKHTASTNNAAKSRPYERQHIQESVTASEGEVDPNKHGIAVAAATAAVAEDSVAAAVVRLTSSNGRCARNPRTHFSSGCGLREELAAVKIQSAFRGYLARRALGALKGLVRLQALVRGHIERKRTAEWLWRMQTLLRAQERARAGRIQVSESSQTSSKTSHFHNPGPLTPEKFEQAIRSKSTKYEQTSILKRNGSKSNGRIVSHEKVHVCRYGSDNKIKMDEQSWDQVLSTRISTAIVNGKNDKILVVDTGKPQLRSQGRNLFHSTHLAHASDQYSYSFTHSKESNQTFPSLSSSKVQSLSPLKFSHEVEESSFTTAEDSPQFYSASSRCGSSKANPFTPAKSDGSKGCQSGYSDHPNYMAYTESSRAKVRSFSAPKQRPQYEWSGLTNRHPPLGFGELKFNTQGSLHAKFTSKAYPGSGRLDKLGIPIGQRH